MKIDADALRDEAASEEENILRGVTHVSRQWASTELLGVSMSSEHTPSSRWCMIALHDAGDGAPRRGGAKSHSAPLKPWSAGCLPSLSLFCPTHLAQRTDSRS